MGNWGASNFSNPTGPKGLQEIIEEFPSSLKQAMFSAASHSTIRKGTWDGCALNAAGHELTAEQEVRSFKLASSAFGITRAQAGHFVRIWDSLPGSNEDSTQLLRETIERAGLFTEPGQKLPRIIKVKVYEDQQKKLREQFDTLMEANLVPDTDVAMEILQLASV